MVEQQKTFHLETGKWMQYDTFVEEICMQSNYSSFEVKQKLDSLISNREIELMHVDTKKYINYNSAVSHYKV